SDRTSSSSLSTGAAYDYNGGFSFLQLESYAEPVERLELEVRSDGYLPAKQTIPGPVTNRVWLNLNLELAPSLCGKVQLPDGRAATGAVVIISQPPERKASMQLPGQYNHQLSTASHAETDEQGRFSLPTRSMVGNLLAANQ